MPPSFDDIYDAAVDTEDKAERLGYDVKVVARYDKALSLYTEALALSPQNFDCLYNSARLRLEIGNAYKHPLEAFSWLNDAFDLFTAAAAHSPDQLSRYDALYNAIQAILSVADLHADLGKDDDSLLAYNQSISHINALLTEQHAQQATHTQIDIGEGASFSLPPYQIVQNMRLLVETLLKAHEVAEDLAFVAQAQIVLNEALAVNDGVEEQFKELDALMLLQAKIHASEMLASTAAVSMDAANVVIGEHRQVLQLRSASKDSGTVEALCELAEVLVELTKSAVDTGNSSWSLLSEAQSLFKQSLDLELANKTIGSIDPQSTANQMKILIAMASTSTQRALLVGNTNANYNTLISNSQVYLKRALELTQPVHMKHPNWQVEDAKYEAIVRIVDERIKYSGESVQTQQHLLGVLANNGVDLEVYRKRILS